MTCTRAIDANRPDTMRSNQAILDKELGMFKRRIKQAINKRASKDGCLKNPDKGTPINDCWDEINNRVKYETK